MATPRNASVGGVGFRIQGLKKLNDAIAGLPQELAKSAERSVLSAGAKPILTAAKAKAPIGKGIHAGLLKASIGLNVKKTKGSWSARVGPRVGFRKFVKKATRRKDIFAKSRKRGLIKAGNKGDQYDVFQDPVRYSHLVEYGTSRAKAQPFIRPAMDSASDKVLDAMTAGLDKHLTRTVARLRKKAGQ